MEKIKIIRLEETDSTNRYLHDYKGEEGELMTVVTTRFQTSGKGQGSNMWESERDKNLTVSIKIHPKRLSVTNQYLLIEAIALAIHQTLSNYTTGVTIKWPNDIYVGDKKISGTLSECSFSGIFIDDCILGSGINVNQEIFVSNAPNPVSLKLITGNDYSLDIILSETLNNLEKFISMIDNGEYNQLHSLYLSRLYRRQGFYPYRDNGVEFMARIVEVKPNGILVLEREDGSRHGYAFKEVSFVI